MHTKHSVQLGRLIQHLLIQVYHITVIMYHITAGGQLHV